MVVSGCVLDLGAPQRLAANNRSMRMHDQDHVFALDRYGCSMITARTADTQHIGRKSETAGTVPGDGRAGILTL